MSFSYVVTAQGPATTKDQLRFRIDDTNEQKHVFSDEILNWLLTLNGDNVALAAMACCKKLLFRYGKETASSTGGISTSMNQKFRQYKELLEMLEAESVGLGLPVYTGAAEPDVGIRWGKG